MSSHDLFFHIQTWSTLIFLFANPIFKVHFWSIPLTENYIYLKCMTWWIFVKWSHPVTSIQIQKKKKKNWTLPQNSPSTLYSIPCHYLSKVTLTKVTSNIIDWFYMFWNLIGKNYIICNLSYLASFTQYCVCEIHISIL